MNSLIQLSAAVALLAGSLGPAETQQQCRWEIKLAKYEVHGTGGERKAETAVAATVDGQSVVYPRRGYKKASEGDTIQVGESVNTVTAESSGTEVILYLWGMENTVFLGSSGIVMKREIELDCSQSNFTRHWTVGKMDDFRYEVYLAFERK